jgi:hypothetical protein
MKIIMKSFLKTGVTNALDTSEGDMLWADAEGAGETAPESIRSEKCWDCWTGWSSRRRGGFNLCEREQSSNLPQLHVWKAYINSRGSNL